MRSVDNSGHQAYIRPKYCVWRGMFIWTFLIALLGLLNACAATIPPQLEQIGAKLVTKCSDEKAHSVDNAEVILVSIESDTMADTWYLEFSNVESNLKYLMILEPRKFALPGKQFFNTYRMPARMYCYRVSPGTYRFNKAYAFLTATRTSNGFQSTSQEFHDYGYDAVFQVPQGKVAYLGRFIIEDQGMKGKGYFGRMWVTLKSAFSGLFSGSIMTNMVEISRVDSVAEDKSWLDSEYGQFHGMEISNSLHD